MRCGPDLDLKHQDGGTAMCIKNLKGPSRSPNSDGYVGMALSVAKVAASWGTNDLSSIWLY